MGKLSTRVAGVAGIAFVVLVAAPSFALGSSPDTGDSAARFASYVASNRTGIITSGVTGVAADFFVVFFLGGLYVALRRMGASVALLIGSLVAIVLTGALAAFGGVLEAAVAFRFNGTQHVDATVVQMLIDAGTMAFGMLGFTLAAFLVTTGAMMARARLFPTWLAGVAFVAAALEVIGTFSVYGTSGFFSLEGGGGLLLGLAPFGIFMLITSIVMVVRGPAMDGMAAAATPSQAAKAPA